MENIIINNKFYTPKFIVKSKKEFSQPYSIKIDINPICDFRQEKIYFESRFIFFGRLVKCNLTYNHLKYFNFHGITVYDKTCSLRGSKEIYYYTLQNLEKFFKKTPPYYTRDRIKKILKN